MIPRTFRQQHPPVGQTAFVSAAVFNPRQHLVAPAFRCELRGCGDAPQLVTPCKQPSILESPQIVDGRRGYFMYNPLLLFAPGYYGPLALKALQPYMTGDYSPRFFSAPFNRTRKVRVLLGEPSGVASAPASDRSEFTVGCNMTMPPSQRATEGASGR